MCGRHRYTRLLKEAELMGYQKARDNGLGIGLIGTCNTTLDLTTPFLVDGIKSLFSYPLKRVHRQAGISHSLPHVCLLIWNTGLVVYATFGLGFW